MNKNILGALLALSSATAFAEDNFKVELLLGNAEQEISSNINNESGDDVSLGIRGAFNVNKHFGVELAYQDYGTPDDSYIDEFGDRISEKLKATAASAGVKGMMPFNNGVSLIGRVGVAFWDLEYEQTDSSNPGVVDRFDDDGNDFYYGVGIDYALNQQFSIGAEYTILEAQAKFGNLDFDNEIKNFAVTLGMTF